MTSKYEAFDIVRDMTRRHRWHHPWAMLRQRVRGRGVCRLAVQFDEDNPRSGGEVNAACRTCGWQAGASFDGEATA